MESSLDPLAYLVVPQNHPATLSRAASDVMVTLDGDEDAVDVLAWCSANNCRAQPVFIGRVYRCGTRCFAIVAGNGDAAFAFRMRWV